MPAQPVVATPSAINLFSKGGVYDAKETGEAFCDAEDRPVEPLEGRAVVASDWADWATRLRSRSLEASSPQSPQSAASIFTGAPCEVVPPLVET